MKLLTNKQDPRNRIIVVDAYINGDRIVCDANSDDFDLWEDCWTIEDLEDEPINPFDTKLFQDGVKEGRRLEREEMKKEQKPVKIDEDIELGLDRALMIVKDAKGVLPGYQTDDGIYECDHAIRTLTHILKNGIEQKPVHTAKEMWKEMRLEVYAQASGNRHEPNYSDDSTKMFSLCDIDEIFEKIGNSTVGSQPAEWSDEDEKIRRNLMSLLANMRGDRITEETYQKYYPWLKDLHPSWKPSGEQMGALNYAYCELFKREDVEHNILGPLQNLIDTLRKL